MVSDNVSVQPIVSSACLRTCSRYVADHNMLLPFSKLLAFLWHTWFSHTEPSTRFQPHLSHFCIYSQYDRVDVIIIHNICRVKVQKVDKMTVPKKNWAKRLPQKSTFYVLWDNKSFAHLMDAEGISGDNVLRGQSRVGMVGVPWQLSRVQRLGSGCDTTLSSC